MPTPQTFTVHDIMEIFWRHFWLVFLILLVSTATAALISLRTPKAWRASAALLLVQRAPVMTASPQGVADTPMEESLDTQISLLQSRALAQAAAQKISISAETLQGATTVTSQK